MTTTTTYDAAKASRTLLPDDRPKVGSPNAAHALLSDLGMLDREHCVMLALDTKHRLIERITISVGSLDHTFMNPREIFRDALAVNAAAIIVAHNHPSGDPEPSVDDHVATRRVARAGETIGIDVLDHLIISSRGFVSMAQRKGGAL